MKCNNRYLYPFFLILALACITGVQAQNSQQKLVAAADVEYTNLKYPQAIELYQQIVHAHPGNTIAISRIADCFWRMREFNSAFQWYQKIKLPAMDSINMAGYVHVLMARGNYDEAKIKCKEYIDLHGSDKKISGLLQHLNHLDLFFRDSANQNRRAELLNINTEGEDYCPVFFKNGLAFVSSRSKNNSGNKKEDQLPSFCKIYFLTDTISIKILPAANGRLAYENEDLPQGKSLPIHPLNMGIKTNLNIGPVTFSRDGNTAYYNWNGKVQKDLGVSRLELFSATYSNGNFTGQKSFEYNGADYSVEHPSLSPDGQFLYFASNRKGGEGAFDIYSCKKNDSSWNTPVNLGNLVNTDGNEVFPFADALGNLYFASDGWPGLGALDIFYVEMKDGLPVSAPQNLGYPVNSSHDDFGVAIASNNGFGYFSSNRRNGNDDIYRIDFQKNEKANIAVIDISSQLRVDGVVVKKKEKKETIYDWNGVVITTASDALPVLGINKELLSKASEKIEKKRGSVHIKFTMMDSLSKLQVDGVTVIMKDTQSGDSIQFVTNKSGTFDTYWQNECLLDISIMKPGSDAIHLLMRTEQLHNHNFIAFLKPVTSGISAESLAAQKAYSKSLSLDPVNRNPEMFDEKLRRLTDSLHTVILKRYTVNYDLGSSIISAEDKSVIDSVVKMVKIYQGLTILVAGFTDCRGDTQFNMQLAKKRAGYISKLLQERGLPLAKINVEYFGKNRLVIPCNEDKSYNENIQRVNRRSEIILTESGQ